MKTNKILSVKYHGMPVGKLALAKDGRTAFSYDENWLENGFSISPFSLPLKEQVFLSDKPYFGGLFGVFADSLPDAWGRLLLNRMLHEKKINTGSLNSLDYLAIVGSSGMGALTYEPEYCLTTETKPIDLDQLAEECKKILQTEYSNELDTLYHLGGTSGGARPKIMTQINGEDWIIKFPAHIDNADAGLMEYQYSVCAKKCFIDMEATELFPSGTGNGYFGTRRFDRETSVDGITEKKHMVTAAALLEVNYEEPCLDYHSLMKMTNILTHGNRHDMENMFRRACFNVFAHNRDDHAKNFTYLYEEGDKKWRLAPAYDLTYSTTYYGEHTTAVNGNGAAPAKDDLMAVGIRAGLRSKKCREIIDEVQNTVLEMLGNWL